MIPKLCRRVSTMSIKKDGFGGRKSGEVVVVGVA